MVKFAQLPKYEAYKDSGVEWLGEIPKYWNVRKLKYLLKEVNHRSEDGKENLLSVSQYTGVTLRSNKLSEGDLLTNAESLEGYKIVKVNDLVSNIMLAWNGSLGFSNYDGIVSPAYAVYRLNAGLDQQFFHYLLRTDLYKAEYKRQSTGVIESRLRLYTDSFYDIFGLLPSAVEQTLIANFLDQKTAQIDAAIAIKEQQIELLKERKQIIIQQAVTQGLDPNVPMKDSGVDWIGQIPEHWEAVKLSYVAKIDAGSTPSRSNSSYWGGNIPWIKTGEVNYNTIFGSEECITTAGLKGSSLRLAPIGTLLMAMYGQGVTRGRVAVLGIPATYNQACCGITFKSRINVEFAKFFFIAAYSYIRDDGNETSQMNLSAGYISNLRIVVPDLDEQSIIIKFLDDLSLSVDGAVSLQVQQIQKLKEYKTTLINSAVTGKIKITPEMLQA